VGAETNESSASCPTGYTMLGGGGEIQHESGSTLRGALSESYPTEAQTSPAHPPEWHAEATVVHEGTGKLIAIAFAWCGK
jgi:hypothetical protein